MFQRKEKPLTKCEATKIYITERVMCQKVNLIKIYLYMIMKYKKIFWNIFIKHGHEIQKNILEIYLLTVSFLISK